MHGSEQRFSLGWFEGEDIRDPAIEKVMHVVYEQTNQIYHFKGLHNFNGSIDCVEIVCTPQKKHIN